MSEAAAHHHPNYTKVYFWLLGLLIVSVLGPMAEIRVLTLITAFGIAIVKAYLVVVNFMHLNVAPRYVAYFMATTLVFVLLFFTATAPDVMKADGSNWVKIADTWNPPVTTGAHSEHH
jgi:caa(3)-type oxidase subunit IV